MGSERANTKTQTRQTQQASTKQAQTLNTKQPHSKHNKRKRNKHRNAKRKQAQQIQPHKPQPQIRAKTRPTTSKCLVNMSFGLSYCRASDGPSYRATSKTATGVLGLRTLRREGSGTFINDWFTLLSNWNTYTNYWSSVHFNCGTYPILSLKDQI